MLVRIWPASSAAYGFLLLPLTAATYGVILLGERVTATMAIGAAMALVGVYLGAFRGSRAALSTTEPTV
jgi:drug/metabolite transporter (DMT)-like permease